MICELQSFHPKISGSSSFLKNKQTRVFVRQTSKEFPILPLRPTEYQGKIIQGMNKRGRSKLKLSTQNCMAV
jgi:hypothetical protein